MFLPDEYSRWKEALSGKKLDLGDRGNVPSGYYRFPRGDDQEAVAIWRDHQTGILMCWRNKFGDGSKMSVEDIEDLFQSEHYAVPYEIWNDVIQGNDWPEIYTTRLRTKDILNGEVWTEKWARNRLASNIETHDHEGNRRPTIGHNGAPSHDSDVLLRERIENVKRDLKKWLKSIGGSPRDQEEINALGNYANKFKDLENEASNGHKNEKAPHLEACRAIDSKWFKSVRDIAISSRSEIMVIVKEFLRNNKDVQKTSIRGKKPNIKEWNICDLKEFLIYVSENEEFHRDLVEPCSRLAKKIGKLKGEVPGIGIE